MEMAKGEIIEKLIDQNSKSTNQQESIIKIRRVVLKIRKKKLGNQNSP